jgi:hypothetical protein
MWGFLLIVLLSVWVVRSASNPVRITLLFTLWWARCCIFAPASFALGLAAFFTLDTLIALILLGERA